MKEEKNVINEGRKEDSRFFSSKIWFSL